MDVLREVKVSAANAMAEAWAPASRVGSSYVNNMWYFAMPSEQLRRGKTVEKIMLGQPVLLGRTAQGEPFAFVNICPHQGVPLTCGAFDGKEVECPFHGWKFNKDGI